jgi:hypothetical protein
MKKRSNSLRVFWSLAAFAFLLLSFPAMVCAQVSNATITGRVTDASGAAMAGVNITITEQSTGVAVTTKTATDGDYTVPFLKPGTYSVTAEASGFRTATRTNLILRVQATLQADFELKVGQVSQKVVVSSLPPLLQTSSAEVATTIDAQTAEDLPLNGRNFSQLALLAPGTNGGEYGSVRATAMGSESQASETARGGASVVSNGGRGSFSGYLIDGLDDRDQSVGTIKVFPLVEDIQEFKVETSNYSAEFGLGAAVVNVITRGGSNVLHGSAYEFFRNMDLDSRRFFDVNRVPFHQNQFGGAVGGPIQKNKTFYFVDDEAKMYNQSTTVFASVPPVAWTQGNFSGYGSLPIFNPATTTTYATGGTRTAFPGSIIPTADLSPESIKILPIFAVPNVPTATGAGNDFVYVPLNVLRLNQVDGRVDHTISSKDTFFVRVTYATATNNYPTAAPLVNGQINPLAYVDSTSYNKSVIEPSGQGTFQETHDFSSTLINQFAMGYTRYSLSAMPPDQNLNTATTLGIPNANTSGIASSMTTLSPSNLTGISPANAVPEIVRQNTYQLNDTVAYIHGSHDLKFGWSGIHNIFGFAQLNALNGTLAFNGEYTASPLNKTGISGNQFADFMLGLPSGELKGFYEQGIPDNMYSEIGTFAQDQWRVSPKLTINWGLRYDVFTAITEKYNRQSDFNPAGAGSIDLAGLNGVSRGIINTQFHNISPRLGLAYAVAKKTVIRAAYGIFYFNEQGTGGSERLFISNPYASTYGTTSATCGALLPPCLSTASTGANAPFPYTFAIPALGSGAVSPSVVYIPHDNPTTYAQQWNFAVQQQLTPFTTLLVAYVGQKGTHLNICLNPNTPVPAATAVTPWPGFGSISAWEPAGVSSYNSLQISAENRLAKGLYFLSAYTWSKSLDDAGGGNSSNGEGRNNVQNPLDIPAEYGLSDFNFSSRFSLGYRYSLPLGRGQRFLGKPSGRLGAVENGFVGGWEAGGIVTLQSGAPFTLTMSTSTSNTGTSQYPNRVCNGNWGPSFRTVKQWFDVACFVAPASYTWGNSGRNVLIGPGITDADLSLHKDFQLTEKLGMTFRTEVFNICNTPNFGYPATGVGGSGTGLTEGAITLVVTNARQIQFAMRFHW